MLLLKRWTNVLACLNRMYGAQDRNRVNEGNFGARCRFIGEVAVKQYVGLDV